MTLTPYKILEEYQNNIIDKTSAIKQLIVIIENSEKISERLTSINIIKSISNNFENIGLAKDEIFKVFENLLISDANDKIRSEAATTIFQKFNERAYQPLKWALLHDISPDSLTVILKLLIMLIKTLMNNGDSLKKSILIDEINQMEDIEFRVGYESIQHSESLNYQQLGEILINYFITIYLKKLFWRLKYKIKNCKVIELDFIFKGLVSFPEILKYLTSLKFLILRYNQIIKIPSWIGELRSLEVLNLNINNIDEIPNAIGKLTNLKELSLWKNNIEELPNSIGSLKSLLILNLRLNQIFELPPSIGNLCNLQDLNLHDNKLIYLPNSVSTLKSLNSLNLSWNSLKSLPESIGNLTALKILNLERNELELLPDSIANLKSLEILNLSDNKLERIPKKIGLMENLKVLNISRNKIKKLPTSIRNLNSLQELHLAENDFDDLPLNLDLKNLKQYF